MNAATQTPETWNISRTGGREVWVTHDGKFVARFKYAQPGRKATAFIKFLTRNFTPSEYFAALKVHGTPIAVLKTKGFDPLANHMIVEK